jgi:hypothetical protein
VSATARVWPAVSALRVLKDLNVGEHPGQERHVAGLAFDLLGTRAISLASDEMSAPISPALARDFSASLRTSSATTAKPRPASPARAASMAALRASRLVWSAICWITSTTP